MNRYHVNSEGSYIIVEADYHELIQDNILALLIVDEAFGKTCAIFKEWTHFIKNPS